MQRISCTLSVRLPLLTIQWLCKDCGERSGSGKSHVSLWILCAALDLPVYGVDPYTLWRLENSVDMTQKRILLHDIVSSNGEGSEARQWTA